MSPTLQGKRIILKPLRKEDLDQLLDMLRESSVRRWWHEETRETMSSAIGPDMDGWIIQKDGKMVGYIQSYEESEPHYRYAGMDIALATDYQGKGLGVEALRLVAKYLFSKGHHRIIIDPAAGNERAIKAYGKVGFKPVGIMRQYEQDTEGEGWHDGLLMDLLKDEFIDEDEEK